jgi:hypothetical protein
MAWVKVKWIPPLFAAFDTMWPNRTRAQDGTIGDTAHQGSVSGHNPDDTPGSRPERTDADSKAEVRAADVDARGVPMQQVIDGILADPAERRRFIYIIFDGSTWRAADGWRRKVYTGSDQHRTHAHFSGHPDSDEDGRPFTTILNSGGSTVTTFDTPVRCADGADRPLWQVLVDVWAGIYHGGGEANGVQGDYDVRFPRSLYAETAAVKEAIAGLTGSIGGGVTHADLVAALKEALTDPAVSAYSDRGNRTS